MQPKLITPPAGDLVDLDDMLDHMRVEAGVSDALVGSYINAAVAWLDGWRGQLGRCLLTQTWEVPLTCFAREIVLPFPDVTEVTISYIDAAGADQTVAADAFDLVAGPGRDRIVFRPSASLPDVSTDRAQPVTIDVTAGFGAAADVPAPIKQAIRFLVAHWYENREAVAAVQMEQVPLAVHAMLAPYRAPGVS